MRSHKPLLLLGLFTALLSSACVGSGTIAAKDNSSQADISWGARLYSENCSACHGNKGKGGVGVPLGLPAFINNVDNDYLGKTIKLGRPGRIMPAFDRLNNDQISAIVSYMRSWTGKAGPQFSYKTISGSTKQGAKLYAKQCASCHGANGEGGHGTGVTYSRARSLPIIAPALNNSGFLGSASDAMIKHTISHGRSKTPMPAFLNKHGIREDDIDDIVSYIRHFKPAAKEPMDELAYIMRESSYSFAETVKNVENAIVAANMRLIRIQNVEDRLFPPHAVNQKQKMVYACGFAFLYKALEVDSRVGLFLPCRVTVIEQEGKVKLYAVNPRSLAVFFNNNELDQLCTQMRDIYIDLMEEATM
ncbi:MAG: c-type cytochrome [Proteobacteria bacterium]|nr:c-type cytochrome [Pseudomonadota bacterium]